MTRSPPHRASELYKPRSKTPLGEPLRDIQTTNKQHQQQQPESSTIMSMTTTATKSVKPPTSRSSKQATKGNTKSSARNNSRKSSSKEIKEERRKQLLAKRQAEEKLWSLVPYVFAVMALLTIAFAFHASTMPVAMSKQKDQGSCGAGGGSAGKPNYLHDLPEFMRVDVATLPPRKKTGSVQNEEVLEL